MKTLTKEQLDFLKNHAWEKDDNLCILRDIGFESFRDITGYDLPELSNSTTLPITCNIYYAPSQYFTGYCFTYNVFVDGNNFACDTFCVVPDDVMGFFTEKPAENTDQDDFNVLKNTLETILEKYDTETVAEFLDNNFADIPNSIREKCVENLDVDDLGECLIEDAAYKWIEDNPEDAYERAIRDMDSYDIKNKIIDYLSDNL
jgi:hypothetical protein